MLTRTEIEAFHANGFHIMRGLIRDAELAALKSAVEAVQAEGEARQGENHRYLPGPTGEEVYWRSEEMWARGPVFLAVTVNPALLENVGQCVGDAFYPWNDSLVVKIAGRGAAVPWHQDPPYSDSKRSSTYPTPNFTTDVYLDHSGPDNGCVWALPGRHLEGHVELSASADRDLFECADAVPLTMEAGDVLFHALSAPHGSRPNVGGAPRRTFYIHYLCDAVYHDAYASAHWAVSKPGWGAQRRDLVERMFGAREGLGWSGPSENVALSEDGIRFTGTPTTPRSHWYTARGRSGGSPHS